jgi:hypothetical protein
MLRLRCVSFTHTWKPLLCGDVRKIMQRIKATSHY